MRIFAIWRKNFIHPNKTRDNRAVQLGKRFDTTLVVRSDCDLGEHVNYSGAKIVKISCKSKKLALVEFYVRAFVYFLREQKREPFDLIYSFLGEEPIGWVLRGLGARRSYWLVDLWDDPELIATVPYTLKHYITKFYLWFLRRIIQRADVVIAGILPYALEKYRIPASRLIKTTNGVDLTHFDPNICTSFKNNKSFSLLYVGHLMRERGLDVLLEACEKLASDIGNIFTLNLVGFSDNINKDWLENTIAEKNLSNVVNLVGELPANEIPRQICDVDICLHPFPDRPGLAEIYPIKLYEYLAMNKAVVASDLPGIRTLVTNEHNGILFDPASSEDLKNKLLRLISDKSLLGTISGNGRDSVKEYHWPIVLNKLFSEIENHVKNPQ